MALFSCDAKRIQSCDLMKILITCTWGMVFSLKNPVLGNPKLLCKFYEIEAKKKFWCQWNVMKTTYLFRNPRLLITVIYIVSLSGICQELIWEPKHNFILLYTCSCMRHLGVDLLLAVVLWITRVLNFLVSVWFYKLLKKSLVAVSLKANYIYYNYQAHIAKK